METSLHRELKRLYAGPEGRTEVRVGRFRVDAVVEDDRGEELIEIQHGPLSVIRDKIQQLTKRRRVRIVKPIIGRKRLIKRECRGGPIVSQRLSPRRGRLLELFDELVYFTRAFPHRNLVIDAVLVDVEEWRIPPDPAKRRRRYRQRFTMEDQRLTAIQQTICIERADDLRQLIDCNLPTPFHTAELAAGLSIQRWVAQRIAYVLREAGATEAVGKQRGSWLYQWRGPAKRRQAA
jgi:hypothetical protein